MSDPPSARPPASRWDPALPSRQALVRGALCWGLLGLGVVAASWLATVVFYLSQGADLGPALRATARFPVVGAIVGLAAALHPWVARQVPRRFLSWAALGQGCLIAGGLLLGMVVAGWVRETPEGVGREVVFSGPLLGGEPIDLVDLRGKVVLLDFWATWCGACIGQLPKLQAIHAQYQADRFEVLGVALDETRAPVEAFLETQPDPSWPQVYFGEGEAGGFAHPAVRRLGVHALPTYLLIDQEGKLIHRTVGSGHLETEVAQALGRSLSWREELRWWVVARFALWLQSGMRWADPWLVLLCGVGGSLGMALCARGVGRVLARSLAPQHTI